jgi:GT2 family glycosyltransferase
MNSQPKIIICVLNWNGKKDTLECLSSLEKISYPHKEIVIIDNASSDDSCEAIRNAYPQIPLIINSTNLGYAAGNNVGIEWALKHQADVICLLNNDTIVKENFLDEYLKASENIPQAKIIGAKICNYYKPHLIDHVGGMWIKEKAEFISLGSQEASSLHNTSKSVDYVTGCAMFIKKEVFEKIGLLEPKFFLYWEESDFCFRAKKASLEIWTAPNICVYHKISASFKGNKPHPYYYFWRNRLLWIKRNQTSQEKRFLYSKVLIPEMTKVFKLFILKFLNLFFAQLTFSKKIDEKRQKFIYYKAGSMGILDFFRGHFYQGPSWLTKNHSSQSANHVIRKIRD